jgi:hypothetical protein
MYLGRCSVNIRSYSSLDISVVADPRDISTPSPVFKYRPELYFEHLEAT